MSLNHRKRAIIVVTTLSRTAKEYIDTDFRVEQGQSAWELELGSSLVFNRVRLSSPALPIEIPGVEEVEYAS